MVKGIDVSNWQSVIDWQRAKADGVSFAMVKASQGKLTSNPNVGPFADSMFMNHLKGAVRAGIPVGVYHYLSARNIAETEKEAAFFIKTVAPVKDKVTLWAAIDAEDDANLPTEKGALTQMIHLFADILVRAGYRPMLYSNPGYLTYRLGDVSDLPLWLAYWGVTADKALAYSPTIWQPSKAPVDGVRGDVDIDYGYFAADSTIRVGDKVRVVSPYVYHSIRRFAVYYSSYDVIAVNGDRVVIGIGSVVTAAVHVKNLAKLAIQ